MRAGGRALHPRRTSPAATGTCRSSRARASSTATAPAYYRTGDIVREEPDGNLRYLGRRDRMIKKRGYRVELGEIETCLYRHPEIGEAAVVALPRYALGMKVVAHLACKDGGKLSLIELKTFCSRRIPVYMIPDIFVSTAPCRRPRPTRSTTGASRRA